MVRIFFIRISTVKLETVKIILEMINIIKCLATEQVRNVASLGGSLLWGHPASDVIPFLIVSGASLEIGKKNSVRTISVTDFVGDTKETLHPDEILLSIKLPFSTSEQGVRFYKHARRKTADLAIANMAISFTKNKPDNLDNVQVVIGGIGLAVAESSQHPIVFASNTSSLLSSQKIDDISDLDIYNAVNKDMRHGGEVLKESEMLSFRVSLCIGFLEKFRGSLKEKSQFQDNACQEFKHHQLFEKVGPNQPDINPIMRPLPHITSAEQCTGEAVYVDDLPRYNNELLLFPVQSKISHGRIMSISTEKAMSIPGVYAWISAKDVPGENVWSISGVPKEEVFPSDIPVCWVDN